MREFNRTEKFRGKPSGRFGRRDTPRSVEHDDHRKKFSKGSGSFELHKATCDACGRECDLPFKPTNNKPVYCRSCFRKDGPEQRESGQDRRPEPHGRNDRFESKDRNDRVESRESGNSAEIEQINRKLDKIMKFLKIN
jgi:CxxC-x17-CxxC domain-containing protein